MTIRLMVRRLRLLTRLLLMGVVMARPPSRQYGDALHDGVGIRAAFVAILL